MNLTAEGGGGSGGPQGRLGTWPKKTRNGAENFKFNNGVFGLLASLFIRVLSLQFPKQRKAIYRAKRESKTSFMISYKAPNVLQNNG